MQLFELSPCVPADRRALLSLPKSFDAIVGALVDSAARRGGLQFSGRTSSRKMPGCWRPKFRFAVDEVIGDQFFSSPVGYRAAFAHSTQYGDEINRRLLDELMPLLLKAAGASAPDSVSVALADRWAKVWIGQKNGQFHSSYNPTDPEILVPEWITNREAAIGLGIERLKAERPLVRKALWGVRLHGPIRVLEVFGAWMNDADHVVPPMLEKRRRTEDIHQFGFA